ncbi:MAG: hypothetical protein ACKOW3_07270 [Hyphomicrobium sp.]
MKFLKAAFISILLSITSHSAAVLANEGSSVVKTINIPERDAGQLEQVHRRYYRYPRHYYYPRAYRHWRYQPYYYRPYYYGYPRRGYIGPNYGYYPYPYYRRWYGPGVHLHFGW